LVYILLQAALAIEATGICSGAWFLALIHKKVAGFQLDEVYVGTPEERAAQGKGDDESQSQVHLGTHGVIHAPVGGHELPEALLHIGQSFTDRRAKVISSIKQLREYIKTAESEDDKDLYKATLKREIVAMNKLNKEQEVDIEEQ
jgi:hypothetical protein